MLTHEDIWRAIDSLARAYGLSASGLARKAGLDPTTFNKSKRVTREGKQRWPSTESISKVLRATGADIGEFVGYLGGESASKTGQSIPIIGFAQAGGQGFFDAAGHPTGSGWNDIECPNFGDPNAFALAVTGDSLAPIYRDGDVIVISPTAAPRRADRVLVKTSQGDIVAGELLRQSALTIELSPFRPGDPEWSIPAEDVVWVHRILWVRQ